MTSLRRMNRHQTRRILIRLIIMCVQWHRNEFEIERDSRPVRSSG